MILSAVVAATSTGADEAPYNCSRFQNSLPEIHVEGTHYGVGAAIGRQFAPEIRRQLAASASFQHTLLPFVATKTGKGYYSTFLATANSPWGATRRESWVADRIAGSVAPLCSKTGTSRRRVERFTCPESPQYERPKPG